MSGRRTFKQLKAEYGSISEAKKGEPFFPQITTAMHPDLFVFLSHQCYFCKYRSIMTGDCSWVVVKVLCMEPTLGLGPAQQQIKEVVGGKVYPVYTFMLYIFLHIFFPFNM